jgi:uncharacterized GH25 family protein
MIFKIKRRIMIMKTRMLLFCLVMFVFTETAFSHAMWLTAEKYNPAVGENVTINIGWGHGINNKEPMRRESFRRIIAVSPDGKQIALKKVDDMHYQFRAEKPGYYSIGAEINPGFMTKTTTGRKMQSRKGLDNAVSCMSFDIRSKTVIKAGKNSQEEAPLLKHPLEIQPLKDISLLKAGDTLKLRVLFNGRAISGVGINATCEGYEGKDHKAPVVKKTDSRGEAEISLSRKGLWILQVKNEVPYPVRDECDDYMYSTSITVQVN